MPDDALRSWLPPLWLVPPSALATGVLVEAGSALAGRGAFAMADVAETAVAIVVLHAVLAGYVRVRSGLGRWRATISRS